VEFRGSNLPRRSAIEAQSEPVTRCFLGTRRDTSWTLDREVCGVEPPGKPGRLEDLGHGPRAQPLPVGAIRSGPDELPASRLCSSFEVRRVNRLLRPIARSPSMGFFPLRGPGFVAGESGCSQTELAFGPSSRLLVGRPFGDRSLSDAFPAVSGEGGIVAWSPCVHPTLAEARCRVPQH
jgi:hypothetical protein